MAVNTFAIIDIGTLKVKFLIMSLLESGELVDIYSSSRLTCFGCNLETNRGVVLEKNLTKTLVEIKRCAEVLKRYKVIKCRIVSTHVMRRIVNHNQVIDKIKNETGMNVDVISQEDEAAMFFKAVMRDFNNRSEYLLVDVGGGSVQVLVGNRQKLRSTLLLQTGASLLHDKFTKNSTDPKGFTTEEDIEEIKKYILSQLLPLNYARKIPIIYGSSNIIDLMRAIRIPLEDHYLSRTHPYRTYSKYLKSFIHRILPLTYEERERKFPFQKGYMWGIDKAFANIITLSEQLESPYIIPSNANIAKGIAYSMAEEA